MGRATNPLARPVFIQMFSAINWGEGRGAAKQEASQVTRDEVWEAHSADAQMVTQNFLRR